MATCRFHYELLCILGTFLHSQIGVLLQNRTGVDNLGNCDEETISYEAVNQDKNPAHTDHESGPAVQKETPQRKRIVLDGYSASIDIGLQELLNDVRAGRTDCIYFDSFKMLTRNTEKLLYVMNYVLASGKAFFTANYYITNGYIERRDVLLPPSYSESDPFGANRKRQVMGDGIGARHRRALRAVFGA